MAHLTKSLVEKTLPPKSGQLFLRDDEITGFGLRVTSNGAKSFVWEGGIDGRTCRDTLGRFPDLSVLEARAKALEYKAKIAQDENPVGQRDAERAALRAERTFAHLVDEYLALHAKPHKRSWRQDERMIRKYVSPLFLVFPPTLGLLPSRNGAPAPDHRSGTRALCSQPPRLPAPNHLRPHETLGHAQGRESCARRRVFPGREARTLPHRRGDRATRPGPDERGRLALARLFPIEPVAGNTPRRTRHSPLGRYRFRTGRVAHSQYQVWSPSPAPTSAASRPDSRRVAQSP